MDGAVVYASDIDTAMDAVASFEITASGTKTFTVYLDGVLSDTFEKEFIP